MNELFDVSKLYSSACYQGLFFDRQLFLWTNQYGELRRLANQWTLPAGKYPHSLVQLRSAVSKSPAFQDFLKKVRDVLNEYHEKKESLKDKYVIAIINNDGFPKFSESPRVFDTRGEADIKLMRYQQMYPDTRFCLFKCEGELKSVGVVLE